MNRLILKTFFRSVKKSFGRYLSILMIAALGVGFFTGLKNAEPSMQKTANLYFSEQNMYDFQAVSTLGLSDDAVRSFSDYGITAEGVYNTDIAYEISGSGGVLTAFSLPEINAIPKISEGRLPEKETECLADDLLFSKDDIGKTIKITESTVVPLKYTEYTIVGLCQSPRYISFERGSTTLNGGNLDGFIYIDKACFTSPVYHEVTLRINTDAENEKGADLFSDEYKDTMEELKPKLESLLAEVAISDYENIITEGTAKLDDARKQLDGGWALYNGMIESGVSAERLTAVYNALTDGEAQYLDGQKKLSEIKKPTTYLLDLRTNRSFYNFENDTVIVSGIANAFPIFFLLIAVLVCTNTMSRMIREERTQTGTLKALGLSNGKIVEKYVLYAVSASLFGCIIGFFFGTGLIPLAIWAVYGGTYEIAPLSYYFSPIMYVACLAITLLLSLGVTLFTLRNELKEKPAELIRPKAPTSGKRIFLEKIKPLWNRLSFLNKVSVRNAFRYKSRTFMMIIGIAGCTALVVTGFGISDTISGVLDSQYGNVIRYDGYAIIESEEAEDYKAVLDGAEYQVCFRDELAVKSSDGEKQATVISASAQNIDKYFGLVSDGNIIEPPKDGYAVVTKKFAEDLKLKNGSKISINISGTDYEFTVSGISDSYIGHYVFLPENLLDNIEANTVFFNSENLSETATGLRALDSVGYVSLAGEEKASIETSLSSLGYIVLLVILCAAFLTFTVLFNLTNINIMERIKEIATLKVLGFRTKETSSYILRENLILTVIGALMGLIFGVFLHAYIMKQVKTDMIYFTAKIFFQSYIFAFLIVLAFAIIACLIMQIKLKKVNMAESLKAVE